MKIENQVCTLDQAKELKELGILQESLFYHFTNPNTETIKKKFKLKDYDIVYRYRTVPRIGLTIRIGCLNGHFKNTYSAFTVAELSVMLDTMYPSWSFGKNGTKWIATIINKNEKPDGKNLTTAPEFDRYASTQAQALAQLLIDQLKIKYLKPKQVNQRLMKS